jgi:hypothetical protein
MWSAFISETRHSSDLFITFQELLSREVKVTVCTRPLEEQDPGTDSIIDMLKNMDVEFVERSRMHHKIAIIDNAIAWEGSLNILSHWGSGEHMRRFVDEGVVGEILGGVGVC